MQTVRLGKTDLMVSQVGFGGIPIIPLSVEDGVAVVRHCFERGITFFDTANMYGDSEKKIGIALESVRDRVVIATKTLERSAEGAAKHIAFSLDNLKTDYIDLYQLHSISKADEWDALRAPGGALEAVKLAKAEGKIKHIGFSSHDIALAIKICRTGLFTTIQIPFNFIENDPADELFPVAQEMDMGIIAMKPLGGGLLGRADLCFKFLQQYPFVVPDPGIQSADEVDEIIALYDTPRALTAEDNQEIEKIRSQLGKRFCHRCGYCMPCEQGVKIPDCL
jgi:predicted aldo/keto reductase-like oxidoreductase